MKNFSTTATFVVLFMVSAICAHAQTFRYDAGVIVVDERFLSPTYKQVAFIVTKNIVGPTKVQFQTMTLEGITHTYPTIEFKDGLKKGQSIPLWNGELTQFETTPWMNFFVTITAGDTLYYTLHNVPVNQPEQYKELMILNIKEIPSKNGLYTYRIEGNFDNDMETHIVFNTSEVVPKSIVYSPGYMQFTISSSAAAKIPTGKFLMTICQELTCDSMVGRHR